jgi:ribosomal protein S5
MAVAIKKATDHTAAAISRIGIYGFLIASLRSVAPAVNGSFGADCVQLLNACASHVSGF